MSDEEIELRFTEPASLAEGEDRLAVLKQAVAEMNAALTAINEERPPKKQQVNYQRWLDQRGRRISAQRKVVAEYIFFKQWVHDERNRANGIVAPSKQLFRLSHLLVAFEELLEAVGNLLQSDDEEDGTWDVVDEKYRRVSAMITT